MPGLSNSRQTFISPRTRSSLSSPVLQSCGLVAAPTRAERAGTRSACWVAVLGASLARLKKKDNLKKLYRSVLLLA